MTKNKKRKAKTRALAKERGISYRTALHQERSGGELPPDFRLELELESFRDEPPHGLRLRVPGVRAVQWLDHPRDAERVMAQVAARIPKEFPHILEDFRLWEQLNELPEEDMSLDEHEWTHIHFHNAYCAVEDVLLGAMEIVGWGAWGENKPSEILGILTPEGIFEIIEDVLTRDSTAEQRMALAPFFARASEAALELDENATVSALKEADSRLRALNWESPLVSESEDTWEYDENAYSGPEVFTLQSRGDLHAFFEGEEPGGLVLRNGDEYRVKAQSRAKHNDDRRCILLAHEALRGGTSVYVRFPDTRQTVKMKATDLVWEARGAEVPDRPHRPLPPLEPSLFTEASDARVPSAEPAIPVDCLMKGCGKPHTQETVFCSTHEGAYLASEEARWPQPADITELEWEMARQFNFAIWVSTAGQPGLAAPPDTEETRAKRAERFQEFATLIRHRKAQPKQQR